MIKRSAGRMKCEIKTKLLEVSYPVAPSSHKCSGTSEQRKKICGLRTFSASLSYDKAIKKPAGQLRKTTLVG